MHRQTPINREGYSPAEFASAFGKHPAWSYRLLYAGKLRAISQFGRLSIPRAEMERLIATATTYDPKPKKQKPEQANAREDAQ